MTFYRYLAIAFLLAISFEARADMSAAACQINAPENLSPSIAAAIKKRSGVAARICKLSNGKVESMFILMAPRRDGLVCLFEQQEASVIRGSVHSGNRHYPDEINRFMAVLNASRCPEPADESYIAANGVSPWLFLELNRFWSSLSTPSIFERATASLLNRSAVNESRQLFRAKIAPKLSSVRLSISENRPSGYELSTPVAGRSLILTVDLTRNGFVVRSIGSAFY